MDKRSVLSQTLLFSHLQPDALDVLVGHATVVEIKSGGMLFREGAESDCMYVVATGRLRATLSTGVIAGDIGRFEPIGEIGVLSGEPRSATVHAVRDSMVLRIGRDDVMAWVHVHPGALLDLMRVIMTRLRQNQRARALEDARSTRTFAIVPAAGDVDSHAFAEAFCQALAAHASTRLVNDVFVDSTLGKGTALQPFEDSANNARIITMLNALEGEHRHLVYVAGGEVDAWALRCMRQADRVIVVGNSASMPLATPMLDTLKNSGIRAPVDLVLQRPEGSAAGDVLAWRERVRAGAHYFLRPGHAGDMASIGRQLTGRGVGLVLGGGGARGFAHIGLMRALSELQIPVDLVGGASMGAFFSALLACGHDYREITQIARDTFVTRNYLNDYLFPTVALIRGRRFVNRLHEVFEERQIEQLRTPFFCVSTNLTRGAPVVHDRGQLHMWLAASMCVPGVAPPVAYKGELLVDGAVVNSLPTDVMHGMRRGPIIASDVSTEGDLRAPGIEGPDPEGLLRWRGPDKRPSLFSIIFRTATLTSESGVATRASRADLYIRMPVTGVALFDWKKMDEMVERGYRHALEKLGAVRETLLR